MFRPGIFRCGSRSTKRSEAFWLTHCVTVSTPTAAPLGNGSRSTSICLQLTPREPPPRCVVAGRVRQSNFLGGKIMWSLPDINRLNACAAANAKNLKRQAARKRKPKCEIYGCTHRSTDSTIWFDIFSDDPKGVVHTCAEHSWADDPDLFACDACRRVMVDHY